MPDLFHKHQYKISTGKWNVKENQASLKITLEKQAPLLYVSFKLFSTGQSSNDLKFPTVDVGLFLDLYHL